MRIPRRDLLLILLGAVVFLEIMYLFPGSISHTIQNRFDLNAEANVPAWYAATLLYTVALAAFYLFWRATGAPQRRFWLVFALAFAFFSLDEAARLHEILDSPAVRIKWLYIYGPFAAAFFAACVYGLYVRRQAGREATFWILGGLVVYALGGMGVEALNYSFPIPDLWARLSVMAEEGLEMSGAIGVLVGCLTEAGLLM